MWRKGNPCTLLVWWTLVQPLWRTVWRFCKNLKIELPYDPETIFLGVYLKKALIEKDICTPKFIAELLTISKYRSNLSVYPQMNLLRCGLQYNRILLSHNFFFFLPFAVTWMDLEGIMPSDISWTEKDKYCMISHIWNLNNTTN